VTVREDPVPVLARHFFASLWDAGLLSEDGAESLKRVLLGALALAVAIGLLLTRVFLAKYGALAAAPPDVYARAVVADHAFLIAVAMWIVAMAMALVGHALFPDETDFRILMAEPLSRAGIFAAKLAAVLAFAGLFVAGSHVALAPLAALTLIGAVQAGAGIASALAFLVSSAAAGLCAALIVVAIQGSIVLLGTRGRLLALAGAVRIAMIGALVLALPLLAQLPATAGAFAAEASWLRWVPPAWFAGLEAWLLRGRHGDLAALAVLVAVATAAMAVGAYVRLYRRFDRVTFRAGGPSPTVGPGPSLARWCGGAPVRGAVHRFVLLTIRRSPFHQGLVVGLLAAAAGVVVNGVLSADWGRGAVGAPGGLARTLLWAPATLMFLAVPAIRLALSVPLDLRANWIFRMAEDVDGRAEVADASVRAVLALGVGVPIAMLAPVQWWALGPAIAAVWLVEAAVGWLLVEYVMAGWSRVPFTCGYLPGKGFVPQMCVKAFGAYVVFNVATGLLLRAALQDHGVALLVALAFCLVAAGLRLRRVRRARGVSLLFEEELPTEVTPLRLNAD
jgi:hypothetical protein